MPLPAQTTSPSVRLSALVAGLAYLLMTVIAFATAFDSEMFLRLAQAGVEGEDWPASIPSRLSAMLAGFAVIALLDVAIAWGLYHLCKDGQRRLARAMSALRIIYAIVFIYALSHVAAALDIVRSTPFNAGTLAVALDEVERFERIWDIAFFFFSAHLILLDYLLDARTLVRRTLSVLLVVAGLGYLADSMMGLAMSEVPFVFAPYTFVGEMALMLWLLVVAARPGLASGAR